MVGTLFSRVNVDDCMWQLQDSHRLIVTLQKLVLSPEDQCWWTCLIQGEPEIDITKCEVGASANFLVRARDFTLKCEQRHTFL